MDAHAGSIAVPASTGNVAVTGLGFAPQAVLFFSTNRTANQSGAHTSFGFGAASGPAAEFSSRMHSCDALATSDSDTNSYNDRCIGTLDNLGDLYDAELVSLDADGFTGQLHECQRHGLRGAVPSSGRPGQTSLSESSTTS